MKKLLYILLFVPIALFGQENYSLSFDGSSDYVMISGDGLNLNDFSFSASINSFEYTLEYRRIFQLDTLGLLINLDRFNGKIEIWG